MNHKLREDILQHISQITSPRNNWKEERERRKERKKKASEGERKEERQEGGRVGRKEGWKENNEIKTNKNGHKIWICTRGKHNNL